MMQDIGSGLMATMNAHDAGDRLHGVAPLRPLQDVLVVMRLVRTPLLAHSLYLGLCLQTAFRCSPQSCSQRVRPQTGADPMPKAITITIIMTIPITIILTVTITRFSRHSDSCTLCGR